jgi:protein-tyrosine phosphatase
LHALGVPRETIYHDYLMSGELIDLGSMAQITSEVIEQHMGMRVSRPMLDVINSVAPEYLDAAFTAVAAEYGSMDAYLEHCGVGSEVISKLRERLLR